MLLEYGPEFINEEYKYSYDGSVEITDKKNGLNEIGLLIFTIVMFIQFYDLYDDKEIEMYWDYVQFILLYDYNIDYGNVYI